MLRDFIFFRRMLTPWLLQATFWLGSFSCLITGVLFLTQGQITQGLLTLFVVPFMLRILCEFMILFFRMNETLTDIKNYFNAQGHF